MDDTLPEGWTNIRLKELFIFTGGGTPSKKNPKYWNGEIPWTSVKDVKGKYLNRTQDTITLEGLENSSANLAKSGELILITRMSPGKPIITNIETAINQDLKIARPVIEIPISLCYHFFTYIQKDIEEISSGTTVKGITLDTLGEINFPFPPLAEQKRIVEKLDATFAKLKAVETALAEVPQMISDLRQSILHFANSGKLSKDWRNQNKDKGIEVTTNFLAKLKIKRKETYDKAIELAKKNGWKKPKKDFEFVFEPHPTIQNWALATLDQLIYISARIGWKGLKADEYTKEGPLFLSVHSLNYGEEVKFDKAYHISNERYEESPEIMLEEEDILLCKDGAGIGKIGIVKNLEEEATINSSLLLIRAKEAFIPKFLFYFFSGPSIQEIVQTRITGSAIPHLFQRDIKQFTLSVPPLEEQKVIVGKIESLMEEVERIELIYKQTLVELDQTKQALLIKAFSGELVKQDPNDEPASFLLEKIQVEKERIEQELKAQRKKRRTQPKKKKVMKNLDIIEVLKINAKPMTAEEVWRESKYKKDIDSFYEALRKEIEESETVLSMVAEDKITYLSLKTDENKTN